MTKAFKCDKCGTFEEEEPDNKLKFQGDWYHYCDDCLQRIYNYCNVE